MSKPRGIPNGARRAAFEQLSAIETDECIVWPHSLTSTGYGKLWFDGRLRTTHSIVCEMHHGPRPKDMAAAHICGRRACMNYRHLRWATQSENEADKWLHGAYPLGSRWVERSPRCECGRFVREVGECAHCDPDGGRPMFAVSVLDEWLAERDDLEHTEVAS